MAEVIGEVKAEKISTTEEPFMPGQKVIRAIMKPLIGEDPYYPLVSPLPTLVSPLEIEQHSCILDIETTGLDPWDSKMICIGALDVATVASLEDIAKNTIVFASDDESQMIDNFIDWFKRNEFTQIIGYNLSFDHRFIFAKCLKFMVPCSQFRYADMYDIMQVMQQVKREFVYGFNKAGSMSLWTEYLFGRTKTMTIEDMLKAYKEGRIQDIVEYNKDDVRSTYDLWALIRFVSETYD